LLLVLLQELGSVFAERTACEHGEPPSDPPGQEGHFLVGGRWPGYEVERTGARRVGYEEAVGQDAVGVRVEVQRAAEALEKGDGAGLSVNDPQSSTAVALPRKEEAQEHGEHLAEQLRLAGEPEAQVERKAQHPLAVGYGRQQVIDQAGREIVGPPCIAARTEMALAGIRNQSFEATRRTANSGETPRKNSTIQILPQFPLDETRVPRSAVEAGPCQEGFEVLLDQRVQHRLFRLVAPVLAWQRCGRGSRVALVVEGREVLR
jgi:hypothetical protein